jgi:hypothetical protein
METIRKQRHYEQVTSKNLNFLIERIEHIGSFMAKSAVSAKTGCTVLF